MALCKICGEENCKKHSILIGKPVKIEQFAGSSPPEIFVGKWNYPNVYVGILSPEEYGNNEIMSPLNYGIRINSQFPQSSPLEISLFMEEHNRTLKRQNQSFFL